MNEDSEVQPVQPAVRAGWYGADFTAPRNWVRQLSDSQCDHIVATAKKAANEGLSVADTHPDNFSVPSLVELLNGVEQELESGPGFAVIGNFPVDRMCSSQLRLAYAGVMSQLGSLIVQNGHGEAIVEVRDMGREYSHRSRGYHGRALLPFHTDGTKGEAQAVHYAALLCVQTAVSGGLSALVSGERLYSVLRSRHPEVIPVLERGFFHHRQGDHPSAHRPVSLERIPVFSLRSGLLRCRYNRNNMEWAAREGIVLSGAEKRALEIVDQVVAEAHFPLRMQLRRGDLQIINNFTVLHSRSAYEDGAGHERHLLRVWLNNGRSRRGGNDLIQRFSSSESRFA